jgi:hypothetical protein
MCDRNGDITGFRFSLYRCERAGKDPWMTPQKRGFTARFEEYFGIFSGHGK